MKKKHRRPVEIGEVFPFRVEDVAVKEILDRAENASKLVNEAIRAHGAEAVISILEAEAAAAQRKYKSAMDAMEKNRAASSPGRKS